MKLLSGKNYFFAGFAAGFGAGAGSGAGGGATGVGAGGVGVMAGCSAGAGASGFFSQPKKTTVNANTRTGMIAKYFFTRIHLLSISIEGKSRRELIPRLPTESLLQPTG